MARSHGRIQTSIWSNPEFRKVDNDAKLMYLMLLGQENINNAGVIPMTLRRWAGHLGTDSDDIRRRLDSLESARFVFVDDDTEEVLVRTFIRNDGVVKQPQIMKNALREALGIASSYLRGQLATELDRLERPDASLTASQLRGDSYPPQPPTRHRAGSAQPASSLNGPQSSSAIQADGPSAIQADGQPDGSLSAECAEVGGVGEGVSTCSCLPVLEMETSTASACPPRAHAHTRARPALPPDPKSDEPTEASARVVEAHRPIGVVPPEPVTYRHGDEASKGIDPDAARASTLTHGYLAAEPMALYERVQPVVLRAVRSGRYGHDEIATALGRLAADDRSVTVDTLRIELAGQPPARAPTPARRRSSSAASYLALADADPEPDPEPWS
jgi:hypothetical protein